MPCIAAYTLLVNNKRAWVMAFVLLAGPLLACAYFPALNGGYLQYDSVALVAIPLMYAVPMFLWLRSSKVGVWESLLTVFGGLSMASAMALFAQWEGGMCLVMGLILVVGMAAITGLLLWGALSLYEAMARKRKGPHISLLPIIALLVTIGIARAPVRDTRDVVTKIRINARPKDIWPHLLNLDRLPALQSLFFRAGAAYPLRTHTSGVGVGAIRECQLSTGTMRERIIGWSPGDALEFEVLSMPHVMKEFNPFGEVHPRHLTGHCVFTNGLLTIIPRGTTSCELVYRLRYRLKTYPSAYWTLWSDAVVKQIQTRVLAEVKLRAEASLVSGR